MCAISAEDVSRLRALIEDAYESRGEVTPATASADLRAAVETSVALLDAGALRVAEKLDGAWHVHQWLKKAVLLSFRIAANTPLAAGSLDFYDKVPLKFAGWSERQFAAAGVRVVPPATVRRGAYVAPNTVLMPSYVNIGAYVDSGTMVDTWATVGSCAQIGRNVHLSGGVGIGGVLEPLQANPTIIEDDCFIGARSEIVEGVIVEASARAPASTTASATRSSMAACPRAPSWSPAACRRRTANTRSPAP
jgi:2,3,4,5-tetrahydropyridine-2-carboxylate N-succinyltransferase